MRKILMLFVLLGATQLSNAQVAFGVKGGVNYNSNSIREVQTDVFEGAESKTGYHAGVWLRFKIPLIGLYVRPELVYTNLKNELTYTDPNTSINTTTDYDFQKIDIPVLFGKKIFGVGNVFAGPSFQYVLGSDFSISDIADVETDGFTVGLQLGGGIEFGKLGIDVRWERAFSDVESSFLSGTTSQQFDTRINQIIVGLSYKL